MECTLPAAEAQIWAQYHQKDIDDVRAWRSELMQDLRATDLKAVK